MENDQSHVSPRLWFGEKTYTEVVKVESCCNIKDVVNYLVGKLSTREIKWFEEHPQFCHMFHMHLEDNRKQMGLWLLLNRTADTSLKDECWFVVNGVPIRYSVREHALITGLFGHQLPEDYETKSGSFEFITRCIPDLTKVKISDVLSCLDSMEEVDGNDRLKMGVLYFLASIFKGKKNKTTAIDDFLLRVVDDLMLCQSFPWGSYTFLCLRLDNTQY